MKINTKDLISGGLLVLLALVGLWLNTDHTLGDARRMGPGYMPMLVFVLLLILGALVVLVSLRSGPDALERWTNTDLTTVLLGTAAGLVVWQVLERMGVGEGNWRQVGFAFVVGLGWASWRPRRAGGRWRWSASAWRSSPWRWSRSGWWWPWC